MTFARSGAIMRNYKFAIVELFCIGGFYGRIHTGSGSFPDSSEPYASGRLSVGFAFTLQTTDLTRTVRVHFVVYTLRLLRDRL